MISRRDMLMTGAGAAATGLAGLSPAFAQANDYPNKAIHAICMFPPGAGADVIVRFFAKQLSDQMGKPVVVENKAGAFGNLASEAVARSKPDGYTIYIAPGSSVFSAAKHLFNKLPFDPINDFEHVTLLMRIPFVMLVRGDSPYKTVADLTEDLKKQGDKASYGSTANTGLVASELYKAQFGLKTVEVKYKDPQQMLNELIAGNMAFCHCDPTSALGHMKSGKLRAIASSSGERTKALPDVPGAKEAGITNTDVTAWWSVHTPKGVDKAIIAKLEDAFNKVARDPEVAKFLYNIGADPFPGSMAQLKSLMVSDMEAWGKYVDLAKIEKL
jgi:tripartite-type tricarboxylate transporter receptor subunit TctC